MKKKMFCLALLVGLLASGTMTAYATESADIGHVSTGGTVEYTSAGRISDDLGNNINDMISAMQPGDTVTVSVDLKNSNGTLAHWYMKNEIAKSMEAQDAQGGAYTYELSYIAPESSEPRVLYSSVAVGGDGSEGLKAADSMLSGDSDYFYLGEIASGKSGRVQLTVGLDGETLGNAYQTKIAKLNMSFAVEPQPAGSTQYRTVKRQIVNDEVIYVDEDGVPLAGSTGTGIVKTGDESDLFPYVLAACLSGVLLLIVVFFSVKDRKKEEEGGALA